MICCSQCFSDSNLKAAIESLNHRGDCPICGSKESWIYDSHVDLDESDFEEMLISIIEIYRPEQFLNADYPDVGKRKIEYHLKEDWQLFSGSSENIKLIVEEIITNALELDNRIINENVGIPEIYDDAYLNEHSIMLKYDWETFKVNLKHGNRFHSSYINLEIFEELLKDMVIPINKGTRLFRSRISNIKGFKNKEMGAPPPILAKSGRVNSKGVSCLYLSSNKFTAVKEIRAIVFDYVTVATFNILNDINVIDLGNITHNSPFYSTTNKIDYLINEKHLKNIEKDLSRPISSRDDSELDYLPTQYISDFVKSLGYDGVKYISTFDASSYNLAIFDVSLAECKYTRNYLINNLKYKLSTQY